MSYLVLARKYRPQKFEDVVGQTHVTTTLANSITAQRVAHAILFSGPRGTGKTTIARILAKTINCEQNRENPTAIPCNICNSCTEITAGNAVDVFEIDGASNNSVDQIRELRDNVRYMPAHSPYKIYIIDEVHMLSTAAFNALLKTLEEPPAHVKFMFATTEPHKIPITILSRCQRHDMRRIDLEKIVDYMKILCEREKVEVEDKSLALIAQESGGSMRDALSLLDQVMSCSMGNINHEQVLGILGTVDRQNLFDMSLAILGKDPDKILGLINDIYDKGHDLKRFYESITGHFRNLIVLKVAKQSNNLIDLPKHEIELMRKQTINVSTAFISQIMDILFAEEAAIRFSSQPKIAVEIALLKLLRIEPALSIKTLIEKLDLLQKKIESNKTGELQKDSIPAENQTYSNAIPEVKLTSVKESTLFFEKTTQNTIPQSTIQKPGMGNLQNIQQDNIQQDNEFQNKQTAALEEAQDKKSDLTASNFNAADSLEISWNKFRNWLGNVNPALTPSLSDSALKKLSNDSVEIEISGSKFNIQRVLNDKNRAFIENACRQFFRTDSKIIISANYKQADNNKIKKEQSNQLKQETLKNPVITEAVKVFDGNIETKIL